jgi:NAD(P)-dependent dehydrogenase (short-subunit alcohol dehydrogenase family)
MGDRMRTVVVGASSGLGRCLATGLAGGGARVAMLARRTDKLAEAAREAGNDAVAIRCDVTDQQSCRTAVQEAAEALGGIDALVYCTGTGTLRRLADHSADDWAHAFATNVTGASLVTAAAVPHLAASSGAAVYLTSVSASLTPPWPGLASYAVSKAALDKLVDAWRGEHPDVGFTRVVVGECAGGEGDSMTQFTQGWDMELAGTFGAEWFTKGYLSGNLMDVGELVRVVDTVLRLGANATVPSVTVAPRAK